MYAHHAAVLKGHAIGVGELQIRQTLARQCGQTARFREALAIDCRQAHETISATRRDLIGCAVRVEELFLAKFVKRQDRRHPALRPRMPGERWILGAKKVQALLRLPHPRDYCRCAEREKNWLCITFFHPIPLALT